MKKIIFIGLLLLTSACGASTPTSASDPATATTVLTTPKTDPSATADLPTETATPEPPALYFTDEFDAASTYWNFFQLGGTQFPALIPQNGVLRIDISATDTWLIGIHTAHTYSNVFIRAKTTLAPSGSAGLICRYSKENGWYEFNLASNGDYSILLGEWLSSGVSKYTPIFSGTTDHFTENASNELGLFCNDNFLSLYVNNRLVHNMDVTNYGLAEGEIGITTSSFTELPMSAQFEWVRVDRE
jgi:hypothetical protein